MTARSGRLKTTNSDQEAMPVLSVVGDFVWKCFSNYIGMHERNQQCVLARNAKKVDLRLIHC